MSISLMATVWDSDLPSDEKFVALALADWADDDGSNIFPSQGRVAWKVGKSDRAIRDTFAKLIERGVLEVKGRHLVRGAGGSGATIEYHMHAEALPARTPWSSQFSTEETSDLQPTSPEVYADQPGSLRRPARKPTSDNPSSDPSSDPSSVVVVARARAKFTSPPRSPVLVRLEEVHSELTYKTSPPPRDEAQIDHWVANRCTLGHVERALTSTRAWKPDRPWPAFASALGLEMQGKDSSRHEQERVRGDQGRDGRGNGSAAAGRAGAGAGARGGNGVRNAGAYRDRATGEARNPLVVTATFHPRKLIGVSTPEQIAARLAKGD